jgi:hypothetical protein
MMASYVEAVADGEERAKEDGEVTEVEDSAAQVVSEAHMLYCRRSGKRSHRGRRAGGTCPSSRSAASC